MKKKKLKRSAKKTRQIEKRQAQRMPVPLNTVKIRRKYEILYEETEKEFNKIREIWRKFKETDKPAFHIWFSMKFGEKLSEMKRLDEEMRLKYVIIERVEYEKRLNRISFYEAYQRVLRNEDAYTEEMKAFDEDFGDYDEDEADYDDYVDREERGFYGEEDDYFDPDDDEFGDLYDDMKEMFKNMHRAFSPHGEEMEDEYFLQNFMKGGSKSNSSKKLKEVYRKFCKMMHPDTGAVFDERAMSLWNEAQEAYNNRNLEKLEALFAMAEINDGKFSPRTTCSQILDAVFHLEEEMDSLEYEIEISKRDPAWNFGSISEARRKKLDKELSREVEMELNQIRMRVAQVQAKISKWENPPKNKKQKKQPSASELRLQMEFDFFIPP